MAQRLEAWEQASSAVPSRPSTATLRQTATRIGGCVAQGHSRLGLRTVGLDRSLGARSNPASLRNRVSPTVRASAAAQTWLESTEARTTRSRTKRARYRPLEPRRLAADKKRASNVKLAWYSSMKVATCCSHCDDECGRREARRRCSTRGTGTIASRQSPRFRALHGRRDLVCITSCSIIIPEALTLFSSSAMFTTICDDRSFWSAIDCPLTVRPCADCETKGRLGWLSNGCRRTRPILIPSRTFGISQSTTVWRTWFLTTSTISAGSCATCLKTTDMNQIDSTRSSPRLGFSYNAFPLTK
jgi:hypothetical protein